ncbi:hypothetical protein [Deinococcus aquaticus]|uniref:hypothetical protein n=1 Tax=Deinococcus aquaticus TaxID=328692 RepID=UPI0036162E29
MTVPDSVPATTHPPDVPAPRGVRAVDGNRAALALLIIQNVVSAVLLSLKVPLGASLLGAFVVVVLVGLTVFRGPMDALFRDVRWRTPPAWGWRWRRSCWRSWRHGRSCWRS